MYIWQGKNSRNETLSFLIYGRVKNSQFQAFYSNYFLAGEFNRSSQQKEMLTYFFAAPTIQCARLFIVALLVCTGGDLEQHPITHVGSSQCTLEGGGNTKVDKSLAKTLQSHFHRSAMLSTKQWKWPQLTSPLLAVAVQDGAPDRQGDVPEALPPAVRHPLRRPPLPRPQSLRCKFRRLQWSGWVRPNRADSGEYLYEKQSWQHLQIGFWSCLRSDQHGISWRGLGVFSLDTLFTISSTAPYDLHFTRRAEWRKMVDCNLTIGLIYVGGWLRKLTLFIWKL